MLQSNEVWAVGRQDGETVRRTLDKKHAARVR